MRYLFPAILFVLAAGLAGGQDTKDDKKPKVPPVQVVKIDRKEPVTYDKDILPILEAKCTFCHSGKVIQAKLDMSSYEKLMKGGKQGRAIIPGKSAESLLVQMSGRTAGKPMPPVSETDEPLSPQELALIKLWIDEGAKPPAGTVVVTKTKIDVGVPPAMVTPVRAIAISPDKSAVAAGRGNQIHIYDGKTGDHVRTLAQPNLATPDKKPVQAAHLSIVEAMMYSPDGKFLISSSFQEVIIWEAQTGNLKQKLEDFGHRVVALAVSPDSKLLAAGGGAPTEEGEIKVFELETGKLVVDIKNGHSDTVFGVCFSPDNTKLATCGADKFIKTFELPSGKFIKSFEGHTHHVMDVGWKGDGKLLASGGADNVIKIWDFEKGEQVRTINNAHTKQVTRLLFVGATPQFLTCSGDLSVKLWNAETGQQARIYAGSTDFLYAIGVSPDGALVAAGGEEGILRLYNGADAKLLKAILPPGVEAPKK